MRLPNSWEFLVIGGSLIAKGQSAKAAALSLTVHQLTGKKEIANYLHPCGHGVSYADIQLLKTNWENRGTRNSSHNVPAEFQKDKAVHMSIDKSY